jgi:quercetin dioxygenase-like cupin family protein
MHTHPGVAEYLHVLSGSCEQRVGDAWVTMKAGDTIRIPPGVPHMARTGEEPCRVVVVYNAGRRTFVVVEEKP